DSLVSEGRLPFGPVARADRVDVMNVAHVVRNLRPRHRAAREVLVVARRRPASRFGPRVELAQLHSQYGRLQLLEPIVEALEHVLVLPFGAPVAQHPDPSRVLEIVRGDHSALAAGAEVLARIEAEAAHVADAADASPLVLGAVRL